MTSRRPTTLYKIPSQGKCMGVCAGLADYLGMSVTAVRVLTILGAIFFSWFVIPAYFILGLALERKPDDLYRDTKEEEFWRETRRDPGFSTATIRRRLREMERRTSEMEAYVTSKRFKLDRDLKSLDT